MARASTKKIEGEETVHYISPRQRRQKPKPKMQPPLTPMIDVTFQLLLFFILTFQFREAEGQIPGSLPKSGTGGISQRETVPDRIDVHLRPRGTRNEDVLFEIGGEEATFESAETLFTKLSGGGWDPETTPVVIRPRGDVRWVWVTEAFNQAVRAKYKNIGFAKAG